MTNKISLTNLLIDIRSRNLVNMTHDDITHNLNERGYQDSVNDVVNKLETLGRLYYITKDTTKSGYRLVNPTLTTSFIGCVWCGNMPVNSDKLCKSCKVWGEPMECKFSIQEDDWMVVSIIQFHKILTQMKNSEKVRLFSEKDSRGAINEHDWYD